MKKVLLILAMIGLISVPFPAFGADLELDYMDVPEENDDEELLGFEPEIEPKFNLFPTPEMLRGINQRKNPFRESYSGFCNIRPEGITITEGPRFRISFNLGTPPGAKQFMCP